MFLVEGRKDLPGTEDMELFASEAERMAYEFERGSDPWEEYRAVLRQEHYDPEDHFWFCEDHEVTLPNSEACPDCPVYVPAPVVFDPEDEPPF
jgi:hypothetical protein